MKSEELKLEEPANQLDETTAASNAFPSGPTKGTEKTTTNGLGGHDDEALPRPTGPTLKSNENASRPNGQTPKTPPPILYKLKYSNELGEIIHSEDDERPFINVREEEENTTGGPVFEIVLSVTVHNQILAPGMAATPPTKADVLRLLKKEAKAFEQDGSQDEIQILDDDGSEFGDENDHPGDTHSGGALPTDILRIRSKNSTHMIVKSPKLLNAIRSVVEYYPSQSLAGENVMIPEPYAVLHHHRDRLASMCDDFDQGLTSCRCPRHDICDCLEKNDKHIGPPDQETVNHIKILLEFLDANYKKKIEAEEQRWRNSPPTVTWDMIWMLLKPGREVYKEVDNKLAGFIVRSVEAEASRNEPSKEIWKVKIWSLKHDGRHIGRTLDTVWIRPFNGEMDITSLKVFPIQYKLNGAGLKEELCSRGKRYYAVLKAGYVQVDYNGDSLGIRKRKYKGRAILDSASFYQSEKGSSQKPELGGIEDDSTSGPASCSCSLCKETRKNEEDKLREQGYDKRLLSTFRYSTVEEFDPKLDYLDPKDEDLVYFLLPRRIPGFILKERTWQMLDIDCANENFASNALAIESLAIPQHQLDMIKALSAKFSQTQQNWAADFIQSKGEGQIFLLHGPPGVGKTYTAECIAEFTGRPLLPLTCADIGTDETKMENQLGEWFALAEAWGAVMLIDEADVYLEERQSGDLQRNSLVSAFLRSMEYYRGILFLTTNRIGHMDTAIMSRVHIILRYDPLTNKQRHKIWDQFFEKLEKERSNIYVEPKARLYILDKSTMKSVMWNGREIRNAFQTAVALAENDANTEKHPAVSRAPASTSLEPNQAPPIHLKEKHFRQVVEMSRDFKTWFNDSFGTEAVRARNDRARVDVEPKEYGKPSKKEREKKAKPVEKDSSEDEESDEDA